MKRLYQILPLLAAMMLMGGLQVALAQVPARISFQSLTVDEAGTPLDDGSYRVVFRLYSSDKGGEAIWTETQNVAVTEGLLSTLIGAEKALDLPFDEPYYLSVELDGQPETERVPLTSAAYSLVARDVSDGVVVRSISGLKDNIELVGGPGISVKQEDNRLIISAADLQGYGPRDASVIGIVPKKVRTELITDAEDEASLKQILSTLGPGGSNTGLDLAYDAGRIITLDEGRVLLDNAGATTIGFEVRNTDMLFADDTGESPSFSFLVNGASTPQNWNMRLHAASGSMRFVNGTAVGVTPLKIDKSAANNLVNITGSTLTISDAAGTPKITLNADVGGDGRVITQELEITGGSDLSENFDVTGRFGIEVPTPGMVVSIDPENPGRLAPSGTAYDRMVAGVVSGAGGIQTGLLMGQKGSEADGAHPVALTGRVYVWVDASYGAITPGDLLTSSDTVGHAMKVEDYGRAQGAILGKAMTALPEGQGLVLMLVTLQ